MPAPTLQAQGTLAAVTTGNLAITLPTYAADDIVVITTVGWVPNTTTGTNTQSLASPWTKYSPDVTTITSSIIDAEYACWWARATSASSLGTTVTITRPTSWDTGTDTCWGGRAYVIRGCVTTGNPYDDFAATAISTAANPALPAITVAGGNRLALIFMVKADNTATPTAATGYTVGTEATDTAGTDCGMQTYRQTTSANISTVTPTGGTAPAQGGSVYFEFAFVPAVVTRTATDSGLGTESSTRVIKRLRTATDSGTGTETATRLIKRFRTVTDSAAGTETTTSVFKRARTATDSATGTETATRVIVKVRSATDSATGTETATPNVISGTVTHQVTITDSASSTETATGRRIRVRTITDTAAGTETASRLVKRSRTATASATGTESATPNLFRARTASGPATSTETATRLVIFKRTVTDSGTSNQTTVRVLIAKRTVTDVGAGTQTATGCKVFRKTVTDTASSSELAEWVKSHIFRVPYSTNYPGGYFGGGDAANRLQRYNRTGVRARNLYKLTNGEYTTVDQRDLGQVAKLWYGGRDHFLTDAEVAELTAAGFGDSIT